MWSGPIHDKEFVSQVLKHVEEHENKYGTSPRMKGMLTVANEVRDSHNACVKKLVCVLKRTNLATSGTGYGILLHALQSIELLPLRLPFTKSNSVSDSRYLTISLHLLIFLAQLVVRLCFTQDTLYLAHTRARVP